MPRAPSFKTSAVRELFRNLRYAPAETRRRQMDAAEELVSAIDPSLAYPEDFITFRITGYRPDSPSEPHLVPGDAVRGDLGRFVQLLSAALELTPERDGVRAIPLDEVAQRLGVSTKTIQRYRQQGLVCHHVKFDGQGSALACYEDALARFTAPRQDRIDRAAAFSRLDAQHESAIIDAARAMHAESNCSLNEAALQLAKQYGRAHETIRGLLRRYDQRAPKPIFNEHGAITDRDKRLIARALRFGVDAAALARRFGRTGETIARLGNRERAAMLATLELTWVDLPTFALPEADDIVLSARVLREGLDPGPWRMPALALLERAKRGSDAADGETIDALIAGLHFLTRRAGRGIESLGERPGESELDRIETDLRWVAAIRHRLVTAALPTALRRIEQHLGRALTDRTPEAIRSLLVLAVGEMLETAVRVDPSRGQNFDRLVALAMDRALAKSGLPRGAELAGVRHREDFPIPNLFAPLEPWRAMIGPRADLRAVVSALNDEERAIIETRWGWSGARPHTLRETAALLKMSERAVRKGEGIALRTLRAAARA